MKPNAELFPDLPAMRSGTFEQWCQRWQLKKNHASFLMYKRIELKRRQVKTNDSQSELFDKQLKLEV